MDERDHHKAGFQASTDKSVAQHLQAFAKRTADSEFAEADRGKPAVKDRNRWGAEQPDQPRGKQRFDWKLAVGVGCTGTLILAATGASPLMAIGVSFIAGGILAYASRRFLS